MWICAWNPMDSQKVVLQVRWVKSKWRFPSTEPRICLVSQLEHGEYTEEMAAYTCKWETGHNPRSLWNKQGFSQAAFELVPGISFFSWQCSV